MIQASILSFKRLSKITRRKDDYRTESSRSANATWKETDFEKKQILGSMALLSLLRKELGDTSESDESEQVLKRPSSKRHKLNHEPQSFLPG